MTGSGRQARDCYWEIGLPSAAMALVVVGLATGQALLSECSSQIEPDNIFNELFIQFALAFLIIANFQHHVWWSLCPRYMVEEGDTLAGIALRLPYISTKWKLCYHSLPLPDSTSRSRTWNRPTNCGPMRAFGLASLSEYHTLRWEQLCSSIQSMIFILHII